ncbi:hypothetical protein ACROYT_G019386 [Oculina patagonica]
MLVNKMLQFAYYSTTRGLVVSGKRGWRSRSSEITEGAFFIQFRSWGTCGDNDDNVVVVVVVVVVVDDDDDDDDDDGGGGGVDDDDDDDCILKTKSLDYSVKSHIFLQSFGAILFSHAVTRFNDAVSSRVEGL